MFVLIKDMLDFVKVLLSIDYMCIYMLYSGLIQFNCEFGVDLLLVEVLEFDDQQVWQIMFCQGVMFYNGKLLILQDVVYFLMCYKDLVIMLWVVLIVVQFIDVKVIGLNSLLLILVLLNVDLFIILVLVNFCVVVEGIIDFICIVNGMGFYILVEFSLGVCIIVCKNLDFFKFGCFYLDEIELVGIVDELFRVNVLLFGDIQMVLVLNLCLIKWV